MLHCFTCVSVVGWDCVVSKQRLDGPGFESQWGQHFPHPPGLALRPIQSPVQWVPGLLPGSKAGRRAVSLLPLCAFMAGYRMNFTFLSLQGVLDRKTYQLILRENVLTCVLFMMAAEYQMV